MRKDEVRADEKSIRRILSGLLCAGVLALGIPAPSRALTLTAVNDSILPLSDSTMPARLGGEIYVPYSVFSQLGVSASSSDGVLDLSANGETLSFSTAEGYVYDQNLNSYSTPAYSMNGTTYVPVKLCCGKFGLSYSTLAVAGGDRAARDRRLGVERLCVCRRKIRYDRKHDQQLQGHSVLERLILERRLVKWRHGSEAGRDSHSEG